MQEWREMPPASAELLPHPASACEAIRRFGASVEFAAPPDELRMSFRIEGAIERLRLPEPGSALRMDGLWHHSCFEAFFGTDADDSYHEFNFAPSGDWAAYRFAARRVGRQSPGMPAPRMEFRRTADSFELNTAIALAALPDLAQARTLQAGLAAVIEDANGQLSYWALAHRAAQPDFHDPGTFTLRVMR
jgi:hypothetical protein